MTHFSSNVLPTQKKLIRTTSLILLTLALTLAACSKSPAPPEAAPAPITEAAKPAYPGADTVMQDQFKALDDAKKVEQQVLDAEAKRRAEYDN